LAGRPFPLFIQTYLGALKSWMLIPAFRIFGSTVAVLRSTNLFWELIALLFLMLATWRWLGLAAALIAGVLFAFDPTYFLFSAVALAGLGFAFGAGPMLIRIPRMIAITVSGPHPNAPGEFREKIKTLLSMYDGSHFYRLMNVGGVFERMYGGAAGPKVWTGIVFIIACLVFFA